MTRTALIVLLLFSSATVQADLMGRYRLPGNNALEVFYQDNNRVRVDLAPHGYMLLNGDDMYLVMEKAGMRMAMDLEQVGSMLAGMRDQALGAGSDSRDLVPEISDTGRDETVAGFRGRVHQVTVGQTRSEVVLTKDPDVAKITEGFIIAAMRVGQVMGDTDRQAAQAAVEQLELSGYSGLLKQSNGVELEQLETLERPDSFYQLPPGVPVVQMPAFTPATE